MLQFTSTQAMTVCRLLFPLESSLTRPALLKPCLICAACLLLPALCCTSFSLGSAIISQTAVFIGFSGLTMNDAIYLM